MWLLKKNLEAFQKCLVFGIIMIVSKTAGADEKNVPDGVCGDLKLTDIPLADHGDQAAAPLASPQSPLNINQKYNTSFDEGYYAEEVWMYGHDGLDTEGSSASAGVNQVFAAMPGIVVLSKSAVLTGGWGESIIIATRSNAYSEEIVTHHYHHMHAEGLGDNYATSRKLGACETVAAGTEVGREGSTGKSNGSHLHLSVRRWANMAELSSAIAKGGHSLFGYGYTFGDDAKLARNLDPEGLIFNTFRDYKWEEGLEPQYSWSLPHVLKMRGLGIEYGFFDGRFGAGEQVKKREAARWLKVAARLPDAVAMMPTFTDLPFSDPDSMFVEKLVRYPAANPVFDPSRSCVDDARMFCPDLALNRAEALKTVIMAFYGDEFINDYERNIWTQSYNMAVELLDIFTDVPVLAWYAPYVYFGVTRGLVTTQDQFAPEEPVRREQMAKWIITGIEHIAGIQENPCGGTACPDGFYCAAPENTCSGIPDCVPSEGRECEVGGGYDAPDAGASSPDAPDPAPEDGGLPPDAGDPLPDAGESAPEGYSPPAPNCGPGFTACQNDCCNDLNEACFQGLACYCSGNWLDCGNGICKDSFSDPANCGGCGNVCDPYESCTNGFCVPAQNCSCSGGTCCDGCHYKPAVYVADAWAACNNNPQGAGAPTLCLEIKKNSGASFRYRVCKQGSAFQNPFTYRLKDGNNYVNSNVFSGQAEISCTGWNDFDVGYIAGYGQGSGAGLSAEVVSPGGCSQSACKYVTGTITITKTCN